MSINDRYPEWASIKQKAGMQFFLNITDEYDYFSVRFEKDNHGDGAQHSFVSLVTWESPWVETERSYEMRIAWDYEKTWNHLGERMQGWQFLFSGNKITSQVSSETFFVELFFYLESSADSNKNMLMSAENPNGHKLEDLLATLQNEIVEKNNKIKSDKSSLSHHVQVNNNRLISLLAQAEKVQRSSLELLAAKAPDPGPKGTPRIGLQDD